MPDYSTADHDIARRLKPLPEGKSIIFDRITKDYAKFYDGHFQGYARNNHEADEQLNEYAFNLLTHTQATTADNAADHAAAAAEEAGR